MQYECWIPAWGQTRDDADTYELESPALAVERHADSVWRNSEPFIHIEVALVPASAARDTAPTMYDVEVAAIPLFKATKAR